MCCILILLIQLIYLSLGNEDLNCYFTVSYLNGSRSWCLDEECSMNDVDIISLESNQCRTNYLSLKYSSYSKYSQFLLSSSSQIRLSSFFSLARPDLERLLQIEFLSPLESNSPFQIDQLRLLTDSTSNIDTYELIFNGNIAKDNLTLLIDKDMFMSNEQEFIDTLRLIFNCTNSERVEWELVKSISSFPQSPCPKQIRFLNENLIENKNCFNLNILISLIAFISILILIIIALFLWYYHYHCRLNQQSRSNSRMELVTMIEKF